MSISDIHYCSRCVTPSTRPRLEFKDGICNACHHHDSKMTDIDWSVRWRELESICDKFRSSDGSFDVIVPSSGGKDSAHVSLAFRDKLGMHPLTVTFAPPIPTRIGRQTLDNHIASGFDNVHINPNPIQYRKFARDYFISHGMPKQPFVVGISSSVIRLAWQLGIQLICYGEQGEVEYGGDSTFLQQFTREFLVNIYYEGQTDSAKYGQWWRIPDQFDLDDVHVTWFSLFEDWDPQVHAQTAHDNCGLQMLVGGSIGTFTNYSQLDDAMQDLHAFMMFVKYGFGRCTSDASIEIRRGRLTRDEGVKLVNQLDGQFPVEYLSVYLDYFEMTDAEFWETIYKFANLDILYSHGNITERPYTLRSPCV